jgi:hypothetical protein
VINRVIHVCISFSVKHPWVRLMVCGAGDLEAKEILLAPKLISFFVSLFILYFIFQMC